MIKKYCVEITPNILSEVINFIKEQNMVNNYEILKIQQRFENYFYIRHLQKAYILFTFYCEAEIGVWTWEMHITVAANPGIDKIKNMNFKTFSLEVNKFIKTKQIAFIG